MKIKHHSLFFLIIIILALNSMQSTSGVPYKTNAIITDAFYGDYDEMVGLVSDDLEDDVRVNVTLSVFDPKQYVIVYIYLSVKLPSGTLFSYIFEIQIFKDTKMYQTEFYFVLLNIATEPGWYDVTVSALGERDPWGLEDEFTFDPPGSTNTTPV
ncbi:MAG: hypothetical protein HeimC2_12090 [Candidatus Heimdallarchaeota archaeon LC_2]|nr:MAG: hypothetical protein HeimC2_12090 [Candidatus Heimdallarchaeota archaeon LC_2]